jgi:hypothetical protein
MPSRVEALRLNQATARRLPQSTAVAPWILPVIAAAAVAACSFPRPPDLPTSDAGGDAGDPAAPTVVSSVPSPHTAGVDPTATIRVTFSRPLDAAVGAQFVVTAAGTAIQGTVTVDAAVLTFRASAALPSGTPLAVTVDGVADLAGHRLATPYAFDFTTKTTLCVNPTGINGCFALPSQAVTAAGNGDSIAIAGGDYVDNLAIDKTLHLLGGFDDAFALRDAAAHTTTIRPRAPPSMQIPILDITAGAPLVDGVTLTGGNSNDHGGGMRINAGSPRIQNTVISTNTAFFTGGGIYIHGGPTVQLVGDTIENNTVGGQDNCSGAGVTIEDSTVTFIDDVITGNRVLGNMGSGGGVFISGGTVTFIHDHIDENHTGDIGTTGTGGGITSFDATVAITGGTLSRNDVGNTTGAGGAISVNGGQFRLDGVDLEGNSAGIQAGAGASAIDATSVPLVVASSIIAANHGGIAGISSSGTTSAPGSAVLINCTIAGNDARGVTSATLLTIVNTAIVNEPVAINLTGSPLPATAITKNALFSNTTNASGVTLDASNLLVDPRFDSSLRLTAGSPLIDAGQAGAIQTADPTATPVAAPTIDIAGNPRTAGAAPDIGADEFQ